MLFFRLFLAIFLATGCGFSPLLAPSAPSTFKGVAQEPIFKNIKIDRIPDRSGQELHNFLLERIPVEKGASPLYRLAVQIKIEPQQVGIQKDATTKRMRLVLTAHYQLYDLKTSEQLTQKTLKTYSSFNFVDQAFYSNTISQKAGVTAALRTISDIIKLELARFFKKSSRSPNSV